MLETTESPNGKPTIVFAGGGHAHLYSLLRTAELVRRGHDVVLVDPSPHLHYSGMATGVVSRTYSPEQHRIDVRRLVERGGGRFVRGRVAEVLTAKRTLLLDDGRRVAYDVASFCLGSEVPTEGPDDETILPVKPVENLARLRDLLSNGRGRSFPRVLVIGGGAAGCEVAANAVRLIEREGLKIRITLAEAGPELLAGAPGRARRLMLDSLRGRGVEVLLRCPVRAYGRGGATTHDGREIRADLILAATGVVPPDVFRRSGLATGDDGGLWVNHHLRSPNDERLFGGGDCVSFRGRSLPPLGVFAVRQGPVLFRNLQAALRGDRLSRFEPQRRHLYVLNLGDGTGLAIYGPLVWRGRSAMLLKHRIDERFMEEYRG
jgi:NADH dehydrogenase FAD-containing subunit